MKIFYNWHTIFAKIISFLFMIESTAFAQWDSGIGAEESIPNINFVDVNVASIKPFSKQEAPGIISVITEEDIRYSGARDMIDLLYLVPGFQFGVDVENAVGIGIRGMWAHEGKVLLLIDGQEMNERLYSTITFGNRFPLDQIKRIEIIRGPGSCIYGGYAELAVINVITKGADQYAKGTAVSLLYGQQKEAYARRNASVSYGIQKDLFSFVGSLFIGEGQRSDRDFTDFYGSTYSMNGNSDLNPLFANFGIEFNEIDIRYIYENYRTTQRDEFGTDLLTPSAPKYNNHFFSVKYNWKPIDNLTLTPRVRYKRQVPWQAEAIHSSVSNYVYNKVNEYLNIDTITSWDVTELLNLIFGAEYYTDSSLDKLGQSFAGKNTVSYRNWAGYCQGIYINPLVNLTLGTRYDKHSKYGNSFVPRIAFTKLWNEWHIKFLISEAFRSPGIENIKLNENIKPEKTRVYELEMGYNFDNSIFTFNIFDAQIKDQIVYFYNSVEEFEGYLNYDKGGTRGIELEYSLQLYSLKTSVNYSFYRVKENTVPKYEVPENENLFLGFAAHKIGFKCSYKVTSKFSVNPGMIYLSERYGYSSMDSETGIAKLSKYEPLLLVNLFFNYENSFIPNLNMGIGIYNIFDKNLEFIQPYDGGHPPLPGTSREIMLKLSYRY